MDYVKLKDSSQKVCEGSESVTKYFLIFASLKAQDFAHRSLNKQNGGAIPYITDQKYGGICSSFSELLLEYR